MAYQGLSQAQGQRCSRRQQQGSAAKPETKGKTTYRGMTEEKLMIASLLLSQQADGGCLMMLTLYRLEEKPN